jgi:trehalose 6-phosphate phosphatase
MRNVLTPQGRDICLSWMKQEPLLAFDFDGTLTHIVPDPAQAYLAESTWTLLAELAQRRPCVVVSGRARADVMRRLQGIPLAEVVGNHGSEPWISLDVLAKEVSARLPSLRAALNRFAGVLVEDKGASVSVHYRHAVDRRAVITETESAAHALGFAQVIAGKYVLNLIPPGGLTKDAGLLFAMSAVGKKHAVYVGDDVTDERVFSLPAERDVCGIRIGHTKTSGAALYLPRQKYIDNLLSLFLTSAA